MDARQALSQARLYGILDLGYVEPDELADMARRMLAGGVDLLQLRAKRHSPDEVVRWADALLPLCREAGTPLIINDHPEVAARTDADGVHVGQDDPITPEVREVVGTRALVGRSTHSLDQAALAAADPGVDYIGFGPLFSTPTKPDYPPIGLAEIAAVHRDHPGLPIFCIGGVKLENLDEVLRAGARRVVIVSGILQAADVEAYVREAKNLLG